MAFKTGQFVKLKKEKVELPDLSMVVQTVLISKLLRYMVGAKEMFKIICSIGIFGYYQSEKSKNIVRLEQFEVKPCRRNGKF